MAGKRKRDATEATPSYDTMSAGSVEARYSVSNDVEYPYADFADEQETRVMKGPVVIDGDLESEEGVDWHPYNLIVDGDLTVKGDVDWAEYGSGSFVLVTGALRADNVHLQGCPYLVVRGDLHVGNGVLGHHGDDGGTLIVHGKTTAKQIFNLLYFNMSFGTPPNALVIGDAHRTSCPVDFSDDDLAEVIAPELLDEDGSADEYAIATALHEGKPVLRPTAKPSHLAALAELDRLLAEGRDVTQLDLSGRKLREFPPQLLRFGKLAALSLRDNEIGDLPEALSELRALRELDVSDCGLTALPGTIGALASLETLDIGKNPLRALPESLGDLASLRTLRAGFLACALPASLERLSSLEELDLSWLGSSYGGESDDEGEDPGEGTVSFPKVVLHLRSLVRLDLSMTVLEEIPDAIVELASLEELRLDASLGRLARLPDLSRLPRLRVLRMDGRSGNAGRYPSHELLDGVFAIGTLEELGIDRWGEQSEYDRKKRKEVVVRPALTKLRDDAFARMPGLRRLDLSFNEIETLPESFYSLAHLEDVNLEYTNLDRPTVERLRDALPKTRLNLRNVQTRFDLDDPNWNEVNGLVKKGARKLSSDREKALALFEAALALSKPTASFSEYDHLYALYGAVDALGHIVLELDGDERAEAVGRLRTYAEQALSMCPPPGNIWHFTDEGAFQEEVTRRAGNALAWHMMEAAKSDGDLDRALSVVNRALAFADEPQYDFIRDTKVRVLLKMGREHDAFVIVDTVLTRDPSFDDFGDIAEGDAFVAWRAKHH